MLEFVDGNTAVVRAAVDSGCNFFAGYPITPATSILLEAVQHLPPRGGVALQAEDEIASIGMCLAAAMAGSKTMTATSGPGLSLYSETIGLAVMGEVPMVIVNTQRMGPATGAATTSADGDVQFARWGTSGGYPMIVLAPTDARTAYVETRRAFNLAERYRAPVIILSSKEIALTRQTVDFDAERDQIPVETRTAFDEQGPYLPYAIRDGETVPAFSPLGGRHLVRFTTSIHDERGVITTNRSKIKNKLSRLEQKIADGMPDIERTELDLDADATDLIIAYGVGAKAAQDAVQQLRASGRKVSLAIIFTLWPVPERTLGKLVGGAIRRIVVPEHNFGQYAREIERVVADRTIEVRRINRIDGKLISPQEIVQELA